MSGVLHLKPALYEELKRLGVTIYDRTEATALLTTIENGKKRGIGAIGMNVHTGKLLVFRAKAYFADDVKTGPRVVI